MALSEKGLQTVQKWIEDFGAREAAKKLIDNILIRKCGLSSSDLADTAIFANGLDEMGDMLENGDYEGAVIIAKETADEMLEDEGYGDMDESKRKKQTVRENYTNKSEKSTMLANGILKIMDEIDDSLIYYDFALAVSKILKDEYGSHNFKPFINVLSKDLGLLGDSGFEKPNLNENKTKTKITLKELKSLVKKIIKEERNSGAEVIG